MTDFKNRRVARFDTDGQEVRIRHLEDQQARLIRAEEEASSIANGGSLGGGAATLPPPPPPPTVLAGDVSGMATSNTVDKARGQPLTAGTTAGDIWYFNGVSWVLLTPSASADRKIPVYVHGSTAPQYHTPPFKTVTKTADYTATLDDFVILVDASGASRTITLPTAASATQHGFYIKMTAQAGANTVTVDPNGAELVDGAATYVLTVLYEAVLVVSDGSAWYLL